MIAANELRVGNLIQERDGFIMRVVSIHDDGTIYCDFEGNEGDVWEFDDKNPCYGVKLTEEILLKCGFVKAVTGGKYININDIGDCYLIFSYDLKTVFVVSTNEDGIESSTPVNINYLHQLQNLYFALTGKELEVKL